MPRENFFKLLSPVPFGVELSTTVDKLMVEVGCIKWNVELISSNFSEETGLILSIPLSYFKPRETIIWVAEKNGMFSTKSASFYLGPVEKFVGMNLRGL